MWKGRCVFSTIFECTNLNLLFFYSPSKIFKISSTSSDILLGSSTSGSESSVHMSPPIHAPPPTGIDALVGLRGGKKEEQKNALPFRTTSMLEWNEAK